MLNPRILIIEDDADLRQKLTTVLEFLEYQPIACDHQSWQAQFANDELTHFILLAWGLRFKQNPAGDISPHQSRGSLPSYPVAQGGQRSRQASRGT